MKLNKTLDLMCSEDYKDRFRAEYYQLENRCVGLGKAILKDLINTAAKNGASSMTLEVRKGNNVAINLYKKFGFVEEGIRKKYYADTGDDAIIMWKYDLESSDS